MKFFILVFLTIFIIGCVSGAPPSLEQSAKQQEHNSVNHPNGFNVNIIKFGRKGVVKPDYESLKIFLDPQVANRKLVIFSIVGAFRKGKSFFMDYCLRFMYANYKSLNFPQNPLSNKKSDWIGLPDAPLSGFSWRGGKERNTEGIVMWSDIFLHEANGEEIAIILMDTQGLFDKQSTSSTNMKIFILNALLSSFLIFNVNDLIQANQIEYLYMATKYAKLITEISQENEAAAESKPFQDLLFLVRDFVHIRDHEFGLKGGNEYISDLLKFETDDSEEIKNEHKEIRQYINSTFDNIYGFLMPSPGEAVTTSANFDGRWSLLNENFLSQMIKLIEWMLKPENLKVKRVFGQELTSASFFNYVKAYCQGFKSQKLPELQSVFSITANQQMKTYIDQSMTEYIRYMNKFESQTDLEDFPQIIEVEHEKAKEAAINSFDNKKKLGNDEESSRYKDQLLKQIDEHSAKWKPYLIEIYEKEKALKTYTKQIEDKQNEIDQIQAKFEKIIQEKTTQIEIVESMTEYTLEMKKFESQIDNEDFPQIIEKEHEKAKNKTLENFEKNKKFPTEDEKEKFKTELVKQIDEWKSHLMEVHEKAKNLRKAQEEAEEKQKEIERMNEHVKRQEKMNQLTWHQWSLYQNYIPDNAVKAGVDVDGSALYVIKTRDGCNDYPGKYSPDNKDGQHVWFANENGEIRIKNSTKPFELLRGANYEWISYDERDEEFMFKASSDCNNEPFYICRGKVNNILTPGRYQKGSPNCVISYDWQTHLISRSFEILHV